MFKYKKYLTIMLMLSLLFLTSCSLDITQLKCGTRNFCAATVNRSKELIRKELGISDSNNPANFSSKDDIANASDSIEGGNINTSVDKTVERVDFSHLIVDELNSDIKINTEEFKQTYTEGGQDLVTLEGDKMLISYDGAQNIQTAINLYFQGFYEECEGVYGRLCKEQRGDYMLRTNVGKKYRVVIENKISHNARLATLEMKYEVFSNSIKIQTERRNYNIDLLTGQLITNDMLFVDADKTTKLFKDKLQESVDAKIEKVNIKFSELENGISSLIIAGYDDTQEEHLMELPVTDIFEECSETGKILLKYEKT